MSPQVPVINLTIDQGKTYNKVIYWKNKATGLGRDITGFSARLTIRESKSSPTVILNLTLGNGLSIPSPTDGKVYIELTSAQTAALNFKRAVYNLELYNTALVPVVIGYAEGTISLNYEVPQP